MDLIKPEVFDYIDYRQYLESAYKYFKSANPNFSYRYVANRTGATSAGWLSNIIKGRTNLTSSYVIKLANLLKLQSTEAEYFETLVNYNQSSSIEEKNFYFGKLQSIRGIKPALVQREHLAFLTKWYISVVRELLFIHPFKDDYESLGNLLIPKISATEAKEAIDILKMISFIKENCMGYLKPCEPVVQKDPKIKTDLWANHMKNKIKLGLKAIDRFSKEERDISEVYMPLSEKNFKSAKDEIAQLRKRLLVLSENDPEPDRIFQCTIQLFPLTEKSKGKAAKQ